MFEKEVYQNRRRVLLGKMAEAVSGEKGLAIFLGNGEAPQNYRGNDYKFRQESSFLYFWGINEPWFAAILDLDSGEECLFGDDVDIQDIIWTGPLPSVQSMAESVGVGASAPYAKFDEAVSKAVSQGRPVRFLPPSRYYNTMKLAQLLGSAAPSLELTKAVISMRLIKEQCEIDEIDKACDIGYLMHTEARKGCKVGNYEQEIVGRMEGVTISKGWGTSFATILSQNGEIMHGHNHNQFITAGRLLLVDAGAESNTNYISDHTRTYPCSGKFTAKQKAIYDIVEAGNALAFNMVRPGVAYRDVHIAVMTQMLEGLAGLGLVHGDANEMAAEGIGGMFMPHGLGHNLGIDTHDMEDLNEDLVGYDDDQTRSPQLGLGNLRMARRLRAGHVISDEPGLYFIPALIEKWKAEGLDKGFVNYSKLVDYYDFGGIRIEDQLLVTPDGARRLGSRRLPAKSEDVEAAMAQD